MDICQSTVLIEHKVIFFQCVLLVLSGHCNEHIFYFWYKVHIENEFHSV